MNSVLLQCIKVFHNPWKDTYQNLRKEARWIEHVKTSYRSRRPGLTPTFQIHLFVSRVVVKSIFNVCVTSSYVNSAHPTHQKSVFIDLHRHFDHGMQPWSVSTYPTLLGLQGLFEPSASRSPMRNWMGIQANLIALSGHCWPEFGNLPSIINVSQTDVLYLRVRWWRTQRRGRRKMVVRERLMMNLQVFSNEPPKRSPIITSFRTHHNTIIDLIIWSS